MKEDGAKRTRKKEEEINRGRLDLQVVTTRKSEVTRVQIFQGLHEIWAVAIGSVPRC
jgi:curli biogenesis system outer membrane secretion channel CsgG